MNLVYAWGKRTWRVVSMFLLSLVASTTLNLEVLAQSEPEATQAVAVWGVGVTLGMAEYGAMKNDPPSFVAEKLGFAIEHAQISGCIPAGEMEAIRKRLLKGQSSSSFYREIEALRSRMSKIVYERCACTPGGTPTGGIPVGGNTEATSIEQDSDRGPLVGVWTVSFNCSGTSGTARMNFQRQDSNGQFSGEFLGPAPHTGTFQGSIVGGKVDFIRNIGGHQQRWSGTLTMSTDGSMRITGVLTDPYHDPCTFEMSNRGSLVGVWTLTFNCSGTPGTARMNFLRQDSNGQFSGEFLGPAPHTGTFQGSVVGSKVNFIRSIASHQQQWTGTLTVMADGSMRITGGLTDPYHAPCTFEMRK